MKWNRCNKSWRKKRAFKKKLQRRFDLSYAKMLMGYFASNLNKNFIGKLEKPIRFKRYCQDVG